MKRGRLLSLTLALLMTSLWATPEKESPSDKGGVERIETTAPALNPEAVPPQSVEGLLDRPQPPSYEGAFLKMVFSLILLLFVLFFGIWIIRRLSKGRLGMFKEQRHIKIIDRRPLSAKTALYLIEVGEKRVLMAESQLEVKGLATIELKELSKDI